MLVNTQVVQYLVAIVWKVVPICMGRYYSAPAGLGKLLRDVNSLVIAT